MAISLLATSYVQFSFSLFVLVSLSLDMESAIKTVVTTFVSSAGGKENLSAGSFQKLVKKQLGGMMEVRNRIAFCSSPSSFVVHK